jgi:hypothetical protein
MPAKRPAPADQEVNRAKRQKLDGEMTARARRASEREQRQQEEERRQELANDARRQEAQREQERLQHDQTQADGQSARTSGDRPATGIPSSTHGQLNAANEDHEDQFSEFGDSDFDQDLIAKTAEFEKRLADEKQKTNDLRARIATIDDAYRTDPQSVGYAIGVAVGSAAIPEGARALPPALPQPVAPAPIGTAPQSIERFANHPDFRTIQGKIRFHTQSQDVRPDGNPHERQHWSHDDVPIQHAPDTPEMKQLFASMGGRNAGDRDGYVIPRGNSTSRFKTAGFIEEAISRPATPRQEDGEIRFGEKIYYCVQFQDHDDAKRAGGRLEYKRALGAEAWNNKEQFKRVTALICCDNANIDRRTLMRFPVLDIATNTPMSQQASRKIHEDYARTASERSRGRDQGSRA